MADWQIIADLSFADLVLWLPDREGAASGRPARCARRPARRRTSTTWSAPSSRPGGGRCSTRACGPGPAGPRGRPRVARRRAGAGRDDPGAPRRPGDRRGRPQHQPARRPHAQPARAVLPADRRRPDPDDRRRPLPGARASAATTPTRRGWATASSGVDAAGRVVYASPNALSVYRRLGLSGDLAGLVLADLTRDLVPPRQAARRGDAQRRARRPRRTATPRSATRRGVSLIVRSIPLRPQGDHIGALVLRARRHRAAPPRPRAGHQGRHHPRDPPPGEEQPADRRRAAAAAGPPDRRAEAAKAALEEAVRRVGSIAIVHETLSQARRGERRLRRRSPTGSARW